MDEDIADRVGAAYSRLYDHQIDLDAAFAEFQLRVLSHPARRRRQGLRLPRWPRWTVPVAVGAVCVLAAAFPVSLKVMAISHAYASTNKPVASHGQVRAGNSVPQAMAHQIGGLAVTAGEPVPKSIRRGRHPVNSTYQLNPGATRFTAVIPPAGGDRRSSCAWILTVGHHPAETFHASPSTPKPVVVRLDGARTLTIKSVPPDSAMPSDTCTMSRLHVASAETPSPLPTSAMPVASSIPSATPVASSAAEPTPTVTGSSSPSSSASPQATGT
jgi:hypothetical protein